jgi:hypothetical protein
VAAVHVSATVYFLSHLFYRGYLPPPFHYNAAETLTDLYHTNYWAHNDGRYTDWESIYPIFTFLFASVTTPESCYHFDSYFARDGCDYFSVLLMLAVAVAAAYQNARLLSPHPLPKLLCFVAICTSFPFLFAVDRGNYLLYAYAFLVLAVSTKSKNWEGFFIACALNLKPYLLVLLAHPILNRDYRVLISCALTTAFLTAAGALYLSEPNYMAFLKHMFQLDDPYYLGTIWRVVHSVTPDAFITFTKSADGAFFLGMLEYVYPVFSTEFILLHAQILELLLTTAIAVVGLRLVQLRADVSKEFICYAVLICVIARFEAVGAYAPLILLPYLPAVYSLLWRVELIALFALFQPFDALFIDIWSSRWEAYLSGQVVTTEFGIMYGSIFRPTAVLLLLVCLVLRLVGQRSAPVRATRGA